MVGRADLLAADYRSHRLTVQSDPVEGNARHALVLGWSAEKSAQKNIAQLLVSRARYHAAPVA